MPASYIIRRSMSSPLAPPIAESVLEWLRSTIEGLHVPRRQPRTASETFGRRLARLRTARGLTQEQLARLVDLSPRMVAYYEAQTDRPPAHLLPQLARVLQLSVDQILGVQRLPSEPPALDVRLVRRLQKLQKLPPGARKAVLKVLDTFLTRYEPDAG